MPGLKKGVNRSNFGVGTFLFNCHHKCNIYLRKVKKFEDSVGIEEFEILQYEILNTGLNFEIQKFHEIKISPQLDSPKHSYLVVLR